MWTKFFDMSSGGSTKVKPYTYIYIELPKDKAEIYFWRRFGRNPHRVTCTCCGEDYSLTEYETFEKAIEFESHYNPDRERLVIKADEIDPCMCVGELPEEGYVWKD